MEGNKNERRKGGKHLEKEFFWRRKRRLSFGEGTFWEEKENEKSIWGRNCFK